MKNLYTHTLLGLALTLAACNNQSAPLPVEQPGPFVEATVPDHWTSSTPSDQGPASLDPVPAESDGKVGRRLSVDQLRASIPALFGGITWTVRVGNQQQNGFDVLARTLGKPDYIQATQENLEASPLFAKFMDDMAGDVCFKAVTRDKTAPAGDKVLVIDAADATATIRFLRLKLHAIHVPDDSTEGLDEYLALHSALLASDGEDAAWAGVCVAMLTAPELMIY